MFSSYNQLVPLNESKPLFIYLLELLGGTYTATPRINALDFLSLLSRLEHQITSREIKEVTLAMEA